MTLDWPLPILWQGQIWSLMLLFGKTVRKSFSGRNLQQMTRVAKGLCKNKNSYPRGSSAPAPGLYTCIKTGIHICIKSDFKDIFLKLAKKNKNSYPRGSSAPAPGAIYMYKNRHTYMYNIGPQRYFFETCNKWAKWQCLSVDIRILSTKGCLPQGYIHVEKH